MMVDSGDSATPRRGIGTFLYICIIYLILRITYLNTHGRILSVMFVLVLDSEFGISNDAKGWSSMQAQGLVYHFGVSPKVQFYIIRLYDSVKKNSPFLSSVETSWWKL